MGLELRVGVRLEKVLSAGSGDSCSELLKERRAKGSHGLKLRSNAFEEGARTARRKRNEAETGLPKLMTASRGGDGQTEKNA